jgi:hypothetical protein
VITTTTIAVVTSTTAADADAVVNVSSPRRFSTNPVCQAQHRTAVSSAARGVVTVDTTITVATSASSDHVGCLVEPAATASIVTRLLAAKPRGNPNPPGIGGADRRA